MSDLIRQNSENLDLKAIPTSSKLTLLLLTVTILSDSSGLNVGTDLNARPGDDCGGFSHQGLSYHVVNGQPGVLKCCLTITCAAGTEANLCDDRAKTSCVECRPGTYQNSSFKSYAASSYRCMAHSQCTSGSRLLQKGNSTANTVCECNLNLGFYGKWPYCHKDKSCMIGSELHLSGECKPCPQNFHRSSENYTQCIPCSLCNEATQNIKSSCTATQDTICSTDPTKVAGGLTVTMVVVPIAIIIVVVVVILVFVYIRCKRIRHREGTIVSSSTPSTSSISSTQEEGKLILATGLTSTGIHDVSTNEIYGQNHVPYSPSIPSLCEVYGCRRESVNLREYEELLQNCPSRSQTNQSISPESELSIIDLRENYEMEEQNSQAKGAEQNVTMNGGQNIYGQNVVINIYQQDKHPCDV